MSEKENMDGKRFRVRVEKRGIWRGLQEVAPGTVLTLTFPIPESIQARVVIMEEVRDGAELMAAQDDAEQVPANAKAAAKTSAKA